MLLHLKRGQVCVSQSWELADSDETLQKDKAFLSIKLREKCCSK